MYIYTFTLNLPEFDHKDTHLYTLFMYTTEQLTMYKSMTLYIMPFLLLQEDINTTNIHTYHYIQINTYDTLSATLS